MTNEPTRLVVRSTAGLRDALFNALDDMNAGKKSPTDVIATTRVATAVVATARLELDFYKHVPRNAASIPDLTLNLSGPPQ